MNNRWFIVFASVLGLLAGNGPVMLFAFGTLMPAVSGEFGWSRGTASSALVIGLWMTGLATPAVGRLVDRFGIRAIVLPAIVLFSLATISVAFVPASPVAFTALYALMGLGAAGQTPLIYAKAISARFDEQRGLALGIAMAGVGLGASLIPQFAQASIGIAGWRGAYAALGILIFLLAFPAVSLFVGRPPTVRTTARQLASKTELAGLKGIEALRTPQFWLLAISFFIVSGTTGGVISHLVPLLTDRRVSLQNATRMLSFTGVALIGGRLFAGYLLDRIHGPCVAAAFCTAPMIGMAALVSTSRPDVAALGTISIGIGLGAEVDLIAFLSSCYFGMRAFGEIYGFFFAIFMLGAGLGPLAMGAWFDKAGSYKLMLVSFALALALSIVLVLRLGPYAYPAMHRVEQQTALAAAPA